MSDFNIDDLNRKAAKDADVNYNKAVGEGKSTPLDRIAVSGAQKGSFGESLREKLIGPSTGRLVVAAALALGGGAYVINEISTGFSKGARSLDSYESVQVQANAENKLAGASFSELTGEGYIDMNSPMPSNGNWDKVKFTGKDGLSSAADIQNPEVAKVVSSLIMETRAATMADAIAIDWSVSRDAAEAKGYGLEDYVTIASEGSLQHARAWANADFSEEIASEYGVTPDPVDARAEVAAPDAADQVVANDGQAPNIATIRALQAAHRAEMEAEAEPEIENEDDGPRLE